MFGTGLVAAVEMEGVVVRDRMVAIDPDETGEDYPNNIRPGDSGYDEDAPIWGVWEAGSGSPPDGEWGWCPVGPFGLSAEEAEDELAKLDAEPYIPWPSFQELTEMVASESLDARLVREIPGSGPVGGQQPLSR